MKSDFGKKQQNSFVGFHEAGTLLHPTPRGVRAAGWASDTESKEDRHPALLDMVLTSHEHLAHGGRITEGAAAVMLKLARLEKGDKIPEVIAKHPLRAAYRDSMAPIGNEMARELTEGLMQVVQPAPKAKQSPKHVVVERSPEEVRSNFSKLIISQ